MLKMTRIVVVLLLVLAAWSVSAAGPLNINTATAQALAATIDGVGKTKAQEIVRYRKTHGHFRQVDDLVKVKGIGQKTVDRNRSRLTAGPAAK